MATPVTERAIAEILSGAGQSGAVDGADLIAEGESLLASMFGLDDGRCDHTSEISVEQAIAVLEMMGRQLGPDPAPDRKAPCGVSQVEPHLAVHQLSSTLRDAELRYRALVENIPAATFIAALDGDRHELFVSPQIQALLGFTQEQWLADPFLWYYRVHPDDREHWAQEFARTCATGVPFKSEYRMLASDERVVWIHGECQFIRDERGNPRFLQGIAFDVTETKNAEEVLRRSHDALEARVQQRTREVNEANRALRNGIIEHQRDLRQIAHQYRELQQTGKALRESEGRLRAVIETAVDGVITLDEKGRITSLNPAAGRIFGYAPKEVRGANVRVLMAPPDHDEQDDGRKPNRRPGLNKIIGIGREMTGRRKDGTEFPMDWAVSETILDDRRIFTGIIRDISEHKCVKQELRLERDPRTHAALHDKLTGLPNRALLQDRLDMAIQRRKRNSKYHFAVLFLDFDCFKTVNDRLEREAGDELLVMIARRLVMAIRATDSIGAPDRSTAAGMKRDEFVVMADDLRDGRDAAVVADRLLKALAEPYEVRDQSITSTVSISIAASDAEYQGAEEFILDADAAVYHAKKGKRTKGPVRQRYAQKQKPRG